MIHKPSLGSLDVPQKNLGPIGSAVLTFIEYKQTPRQAKFIYRCKYKLFKSLILFILDENEAESVHS